MHKKWRSLHLAQNLKSHDCTRISWSYVFLNHKQLIVHKAEEYDVIHTSPRIQFIIIMTMGVPNRPDSTATVMSQPRAGAQLKAANRS